MMKNLLISICFIAAQCQLLLAQEVHFPLENARWCYYGYADMGQPLGTDCFSPDSVLHIGGKTYARITYKSDPYSSHSTLFYRDSLGQFFVLPQDSTEEILVYDFNLTVGDTFLIRWAWAWGEPREIVVQQVDSITTLDGVVRKRLILSNGSLYGTWVEGIGEINSVFCQPAYFFSVSGGYGFECFSSNSALIYPDLGIGVNCPTVSTSDPFSLPATVQLYPNPVKDHLTIHVEASKLLSVRILDSQGKPLYTKKTVQNIIDIPVQESLPAGVYFVQLMMENGVLVRKMTKE